MKVSWWFPGSSQVARCFPFPLSLPTELLYSREEVNLGPFKSHPCMPTSKCFVSYLQPISCFTYLQFCRRRHARKTSTGFKSAKDVNWIDNWDQKTTTLKTSKWIADWVKLTTSFQRSQLKPSCKTIKIAYMYFWLFYLIWFRLSFFNSKTAIKRKKRPLKLWRTRTIHKIKSIGRKQIFKPYFFPWSIERKTSLNLNTHSTSENT